MCIAIRRHAACADTSCTLVAERPGRSRTAPFRNVRHVAERLFVSPRTVQAHLTHMYTKLGYSSRVQLAQEAARQSQPS